MSNGIKKAVENGLSMRKKFIGSLFYNLYGIGTISIDIVGITDYNRNVMLSPCRTHFMPGPDSPPASERWKRLAGVNCGKL
ncbi:hypothetical protein HNQ56_004129 [Anaerotaenia torta]|uniref:hypothetical protein n=1 Tax=Anaerotaenia torta TaxID=433293 RepID=UPI003D1D0483